MPGVEKLPLCFGPQSRGAATEVYLVFRKKKKFSACAIDRRIAFLAYLDFNINNFHLHSAHGVHALYYCSPAKYAQKYITSGLESKLPWLFNIQCVDFGGSKLQAPRACKSNHITRIK